MIGSELPYEAAESRPFIVAWLTRWGVLASVGMVLAAATALFATTRALAQTSRLYSIKPTGEAYEVRAFPDVNTAAREARRISAPALDAGPAAGARAPEIKR